MTKNGVEKFYIKDRFGVFFIFFCFWLKKRRVRNNFSPKMKKNIINSTKVVLVLLPINFNKQFFKYFPVK